MGDLPPDEPLPPIAIVGMSCKFAGDATSPRDLFNLCAQARDAWSPIPPSRFNAEAFYHPDSARNGTNNIKGAFFLREDLAPFDAPFFHLTRAEAASLDPEQRLLLECAYESLENAGLPLSHMAGSPTGVFVGTFMSDWGEITRRDPDAMPLYQPTGSGVSMLAGRLSYYYDLRGPSLTVDTACSASFVALHSAVLSLRGGECSTALVGGVNSLLNHDFLATMSSMRFLSPDGRSYTYESRADGYARGEGVACLVLKRLDDALRDGDNVRAVIRGTGLNQDGKTPGITHPSGEQQAALIRSVYDRAGLDTRETSYVEAHGTGTQVGDVVEAKALYEAFGRRRTPDMAPLLVGSVKTNIGHVEGASGLAGLVKVVMMLERGCIVGNAGFTELNEKIKLKEWNMQVPTETMPWDAPVRRASINNFGYAGTNAHVIVEHAGDYLRQNGLLRQTPSIPASDRPLLFILSAFDEFSSKAQADRHAAFLDQVQDRELLSDVAAILATRRSRMSWKTAVVASTPDELRLKLSTAKPQNSRKAPSLGFVFTGQGAQWPGMGRQLLDLPAFRHSLTLSSASLHSLGADWDVVDELTRETDSRVNEAAISQPLCTILQIALVDLLSSWAIKPTAVVGHSSGELAAGYASGLASRRDAIASAYHRGLVSQQSNNGHDCAGAMAAIQAPEETVLHLLGRIASSAAIACYNSPSLITVSGDATAIDELTALCEAEHISLRRLPVDVAYHSSRMRAVAVPYIEAMRACARTVNHPVQTCDMFSSVRGDKMPAVGRLVPEYWADNLTSPVRFSDALVAMCTQTRLGNKASIDCLVELGPHSTLASPIRQIIQGQSRLSGITYLSALKRGDNALETALALAGRLFEHGCPVDIEAVNGGCRTPRPAIIAAMPSYPWNHEVAYWAEPRASKQYRMRKWPRHDILGAPVHFSNALEPRWRNWIRCSELPWLRDHRVNGLMVYPAAGYVAMAVEGARQGALARNVEIKGYEIRDLRIGQALVIPEGTEEIETMMSMRPCTESSRTASTTWSEFIVYSADESDEGLWSENCRGLISVRGKTDMSEVSGAALADQKRENLKRKRGEMEMLCTASKASEAFYADFASIGVEYEGIFANVTSAKFGHGAAVSKVSYPDVETCMPMHHHSPFVIHPSFLDSAFQVAALGLSDGRSKVAAMVPTFISQVYISDGVAKTPGAEFSVYSKVDRVSLRDADMTIDIYDDAHDAQVSAVSLSGFTMTSLSGSLKAASETPTPQTCYTPQWTADPDLLQTEHLESLCSDLRAPGLDDETLRTLDEATFYMAEETMQKIPVAMLPSLSTKSQNLFQSIYEMVDKVHSGEFGAAAIEWTKSDRAAREAIWDKVKAAGDEGGLYLAFRENLHRIILGEVDSLSVVMKDDILGRYYAADVRMSTQYRQAAAYIDLLANKNPALKVLEVGAGTGGATIPILKTAGGRISSYDITDISTGFFEKLREKTGTWSHLIKFGKLNIEHDPEAQGYEPASYDVVVASNVLHATEKMERTLSHVKQLLKPGGKLVLVELMKDLRACTRIFGVFDGWWVGAGDGRTDSPLLNEEGWDALLKKTGFGGIDLKVWDLPDASVHQGTTIIASRQTEAENQDVRPVIVVVRADDVSSSHVQALQTALGLGSDDVVLASQISETGDRPAIVVAELSGSLLNSPSASDLQAVQKVVTKNQVLWVTQGAAFPSQNPNLALVSGLFATLRAELGGSLVHLDGDPEQSLDDPVLAATIARVYHHVQTRNDTGHESDHDFAFRHGTVMIRRLNKDSRFTEAVCSTLGHREPLTLPYVQPTVDGRSLKLKIKTPGLLDSIYFDDDETMLLPPKGDELDILVESTALNFRDIMMAMGQIDMDEMGAECSGFVARIGPDVKSLQVGDRVVAQAFGAFSTRARTREIFTSKIAPDMELHEAAALPIVFSTAVYAIKVARLSAGDTVLIHCAAGGLGQALVMLCKTRGASVYITVGTSSKKKFMMDEYGIAEERIFTSRDASFQEGVMHATGGVGVDVVFNSLSGDLLRDTWECIAPFGRFVELGKRDFAINARLEMAKFARNVTFAAVDLAGVIRERPEEAAAVQREAMSLVMNGAVHAPRPISTYSMAELETAMRTMQTGRHMGKLVIRPRLDDMVRVLPPKLERASFHADASYLLIGGLGGIGRAWAKRMIHLGARHLIFMSPSGTRKPAAKAALDELQAQEGLATTRVFECDVSSRDDLSTALSQIADLPPIKGVFHCASNYTGDLFANTTQEGWMAGLRPKVHATWNLHELLPLDMDHFVFLSSATSIAGNTGQAAYSAASAFQDAFADWRNNALGLPAVSIDLGMVAGVGHVAEHADIRRSLLSQGYAAIPEEECMAIIEAAVTQSRREGRCGNVVMGLNAPEGADSLARRTATMSHVRRDVGGRQDAGGRGDASGGARGSGGSARVRDLLKKATTLDEVERHVADALLAKMCGLLMVPTTDVDVGKPMNHYGLDSLIAVEMRNWIASDVEVTVPVLQLLGNNSIQELAKTIAHQTRVAKALNSKGQ